MRPRFFIWILGLLAVLAASSCAPAVATVPPALTDAPIPATAASVDSSAPEATTSVPAQPVEVQAIATSRGPDLEASDPATVALASGQLQLVEFFRFT